MLHIVKEENNINLLINNSIINEKDIIKNNTHYIYLIKLREFIRTNENIYKIGRTSQNAMKRMNQYPKGSEIIIFRKCIDSIKIELELIKRFKLKYIHKNNYGNEYFEGFEMDMVKDINAIIDNEMILYNDINNNINNNTIITINNNDTIFTNNNNKQIQIKEDINDLIIIENNLKKKSIIDLSNEIIINNYQDLIDISDCKLFINIIDINNKYGYYQFNDNNKSYFFGNELDEKLIDILYNNYSHISDIGYINIINNKYISCTKFHLIMDNYKYNTYRLIYYKIDYDKIIENLCII